MRESAFTRTQVLFRIVLVAELTCRFFTILARRSGSVCLDVINQTWSPMYDLTNIFEVFLPQLLTYPNPTDPLNGEAAALQMREPERYKQKVREYVQKYAKPEDFPSGPEGDADEDEDGSDFSMSESEGEDDDDEPGGGGAAPSTMRSSGGSMGCDDRDGERLEL